ncbi:MAG: glycosyltransferase family 39 protein [Gemmatimonadaceae bacterium]
MLRAPGIRAGNDDAVYLFLSRSLRSLEYREMFFTDDPWHSKYPPGYPLLLAAVATIAGESTDAFVVMNIILSVGALILIFDVVRRLWSPELALMVLMMGAVNFALVDNAGKHITETPYMALTAVALWLLVVRPNEGRSAAAAAGVAILAALTRSIGIILLGAMFVWWVLQRQFRRAVVFGTLSALTVGAWLAWTVVAPQRSWENSYVGDAVAAITGGGNLSLTARLSKNVFKYVGKGIPAHLGVPTIQGTTIDNLFWLVIIVGCLGIGAWTLWARWRLMFLYMGFYLAFLVFWRYPVSRFLDPILPLLIVTLLAGAMQVGMRVVRRASWALPLVLAVTIGATSASQLLAEWQKVRLCDRSRPLESHACFTPDQLAMFAAATYARTHTSRDARFVFFDKEAMFSYYSEREMVADSYVLPTKSEDMVEWLRRAGVDYIAVGTRTAGEVRLGKALLAICDRLETVATFPPQAAIFRVKTPAGSNPDSQACTLLSSFQARRS